jgi:hypothetical protein
MQQRFYSSVQNFIVNAFGIAVVRNMGPKGYLDCICRFLKKVNLADLSKKDPSQYPKFLDDETEKLVRHMPSDAQHWGTARKCLNLFFRDALYKFYLRENYDLAKCERYLEIPLDSNVGKQLRKEDRGLPGWRTVKNLTPDVSAQFQEVASRIAKREGTARVHLDVLYWRGGE